MSKEKSAISVFQRLAELFIVADILLLLQMCEPFNRQLYVIEIDILKGDRVYFSAG